MNANKKWYIGYPGGSSRNIGNGDGPGPAAMELIGPEGSALFDCGIEFGENDTYYTPNFDAIEGRIKNIVLSHKHYDHAGALAHI